MVSKVLFGTDGIRGQANVYPITVEFMLAVGKALAFWLHKPKASVVIGKDTRLSCYAMEQALTAGLSSMGVEVLLCGPLPTAGVAYLTRHMNADAGIMISASHNPYQDNGIKIFGSDGFKLSDAQEQGLEELILNPQFENPPYSQIARVRRINDATDLYAQHLKASLRKTLNLTSLRIVLDCAHGAAYKLAPRVLRELGAEVFVTGNEPNGLNINDHTGSLHPQTAQALVKQHKAHLGIVLDGDADRIVVIDELGEVVSGDALLALIASHLKVDTLVCTDMSNLGLELCLKPLGIAVQRTRVGDRYVVERLRSEKYLFGGEESGHLIFMNQGTTGDGIAGALEVLAILLDTQKPLSELKKVVQLLPRAVENRLVSQKTPLENLKNSSILMKQIEQKLGSTGRLFVRYSGTESKLRVLVECPSGQEASLLATQIADSILKEIG